MFIVFLSFQGNSNFLDLLNLKFENLGKIALNQNQICFIVNRCSGAQTDDNEKLRSEIYWQCPFKGIAHEKSIAVYHKRYSRYRYCFSAMNILLQITFCFLRCLYMSFFIVRASFKFNLI